MLLLLIIGGIITIVLILSLGPALFSWKDDREQMFNGETIEFRLNNKSHPQLEDLVEVNWELRWQQQYKKVNYNISIIKQQANRKEHLKQ